MRLQHTLRVTVSDNAVCVRLRDLFQRCLKAFRLTCFERFVLTDVSKQSGLLVLRDSFEGSHHGKHVHLGHRGRHLPHVHCTWNVQPAHKNTTGNFNAFQHALGLTCKVHDAQRM